MKRGFARLKQDRHGLDAVGVESNRLAAGKHVRIIDVVSRQRELSQLVGAGQKLHAAVFDSHRRQRDPHRQDLARVMTEIGVVLMPADIVTAAALFGPDGVVIQHDVGADDILDNVEQGGTGRHLVYPGKAKIELGLAAAGLQRAGRLGLLDAIAERGRILF